MQGMGQGASSINRQRKEIFLHDEIAELRPKEWGVVN